VSFLAHIKTVTSQGGAHRNREEGKVDIENFASKLRVTNRRMTHLAPRESRYVGMYPAGYPDT